MTTVQSIYNFFNKIAPFDTAMDFDNVGILVGDKDKAIKRVIVALDITDLVVREAYALKADLIISHHPVIFNPLTRLDSNSIPYKLANLGISAICVHTNLDMAKEGVNYWLANALELNVVGALSYYECKEMKLPLGLVGFLSNPYTPEGFARYVKERLDCSGVRFIKTCNEISKVGICSGAGGDLIDKAKKLNVDAFVTGEIKHHEILFASENNICVVDAGHFKTEDVVILPLVKMLSKEFSDIEFIKSRECDDGIKYLV